jgi:hypothetical protein
MRVIGRLHTLATLPVGERSPISWLWGWVGVRASLSILEKRKISAYAENQNLDQLAHCLVTILTMLLWLLTIMTHWPSKSFIIAHTSFINACIVTSCNEISLKIYLILDVMFMLPNVNMAIMDSVTIIWMLLQTVIMANFQCNAFIGYSFLSYQHYV